jgi:hypothetical protein
VFSQWFVNGCTTGRVLNADGSVFTARHNLRFIFASSHRRHHAFVSWKWLPNAVPLAASHTRTVASSPPDTMRDPSAVAVSDHTVPSCLHSGSQIAASPCPIGGPWHPPDTIREPSGSTSTNRTSLSCPGMPQQRFRRCVDSHSLVTSTCGHHMLLIILGICTTQYAYKPRG